MERELNYLEHHLCDEAAESHRYYLSDKVVWRQDGMKQLVYLTTQAAVMFGTYIVKLVVLDAVLYVALCRLAAGLFCL